MFRGREIEHADLGMRLLRTVAEDLVDDALLEVTPHFEGRFLTMTLSPNTRNTAAAAEPQPEREPQRAKA